VAVVLPNQSTACIYGCCLVCQNIFDILSSVIELATINFINLDLYSVHSSVLRLNGAKLGVAAVFFPAD